MKFNIIIVCFLLFFANKSISAQNLATDTNPIRLSTERFVGIDNFSAVYTINQNILYKSWNAQIWQFGDYTLGTITKVSITNPLKILLFYQNLNTVVILDKYLNEIERIDFNTTVNFKNPSFVSLANDQSIWLFDNNAQQLELFDLETENTLFTTLPVKGIPIDEHCNFNYCWMLTENKILQFNIYGNQLTEINNNNFEQIHIYKKGILLKKEDALYSMTVQAKEFKKLNLPKIPIEHFYVTGEILYIYSAGMLYSFDLPSILN